MTRSSLNPLECCGLERGCVWSQQALAHPHTGRDVTTESCCLSARSAEQGRCCYIISLLNKTSKIFNLAFCDHMAWVQAAWFYMGAQMDIVSPSPSCLVLLFSDVPMELFFFFEENTDPCQQALTGIYRRVKWIRCLISPAVHLGLSTYLPSCFCTSCCILDYLKTFLNWLRKLLIWPLCFSLKYKMFLSAKASVCAHYLSGYCVTRRGGKWPVTMISLADCFFFFFFLHII